MKKTFSFAFLLISINVLGQVQWANKVLQVSSERKIQFDKHQYRAEQALGAPNVLPAANPSACAWSPASPKLPEATIKVGFANPMNVKQVLIAQNSNAGAVYKVYLYDTGGKAHLIYRQTNIVPTFGGILSLKVPRTPYKVNAVKLHLAPFKVSGYNEIDAIGISESDAPYLAKINLAKKLGAVSKAEKLNFNTESAAEVVPVISPDGKQLYFARDGHTGNVRNADGSYHQDAWVAKINDDGSIENPVNLGAPINNAGHNAIFSISADGNTALLLNKYTSAGMVKGYSISKKVGNKWSTPTAINIEGVQNLSEQTAVYLSQDNKVLILSIQDDQSHGGNDLYVSFNKGGNNWSKPKNLGPVINTAEKEITPFLASDGKTLYFASKGFSGYGNTDVYVSQRLDDSWTNWSKPQNLGKEINTNGWESYFSIEASGIYAYFTKTADIYRIKLSEENRPKAVALIRGIVTDSKTKGPLDGAKIIIQKVPENTTEADMLADKGTGAYKNILKLGKKYHVTAERKGYFSQTVTVDISDKKNYFEIEQNFELSPLEKGTSVRLNNVYFNRGKSRLLPESFPELDKLHQMMVDNPEVNIRLEGHTEIFGSKKVLQQLSEARVKSVKRYLTDKGIDEKRIKTKGFGPSRPISREKTDEARSLNRRVEVKVL